MIREFPPDYELVAFFEAEPVVLDPEAPWVYNTLDFQTVRNGIEVRCRIAPSYGELTVRLMLEGEELAKYELCGAETFRLVMEKGREVLAVAFAPEKLLDNFALQLKPRVWAAWGNLHQFP
ncbi:MAG: hypothetical protein ACLPX9_02520 [Rhodomicrobium sp.]